MTSAREIITAAVIPALTGVGVAAVAIGIFSALCHVGWRFIDGGM